MRSSNAKLPADTRRRVEPSPPPNQNHAEAEAEIAGYIAQMTGEMMLMASKARLDLLCYLLSIARTEAEVVARQGFSDPPSI